MSVSRNALRACFFATAVAACSQPVVDNDVTSNDASDVSTGIDAHDAQSTADVSPSPGCNTDGGFNCNGDYVGRCSPACQPGYCCSPQHGQFACVPPDANGHCPAADIFVDATKIEHDYAVEWQNFAANSCSIAEGCVNGPGWRRLLRFDTWTPNQGGADLYLGTPNPSNPNFEYSSCHQHYHFNSYAKYELRDTGGGIAARGHKQAFCLEDFYEWPWDGQMQPEQGATYNCSGPQGIQMQWQDVYARNLACQWVDVTDVAPGNYTLHIALNTSHLLNESNYDNNQADVQVVIPADDTGADPTTPCAMSDQGDRSCGWTRDNSYTCTPGSMVSAGCSAACSLGTCSGDTIMRVYDGNRPTSQPWDLRSVIVLNDDSGCGNGRCGSGGDCCSRAQFVCPLSGHYTVLWAPYRTTDTAVTCTVAHAP